MSTRMTTREYTYFIQMGDDGPIKIGRSHDPWDRLLSLQTASPYELKLLLVIRGAEFEAILHERLAHLALRGEWFRPDASLVEFICELASKADRHLATAAERTFEHQARKRRKQSSPPRPAMDEVPHSLLTPEEIRWIQGRGRDNGRPRAGYWQFIAPIARPCDLASRPLPLLRGHHEIANQANRQEIPSAIDH